MTFKKGDPMWVDLGSDQFELSKKFYTELFGWEFIDTGAEFGHYNIITLNGERIGGAMNSLIGPEGPLEEAPTPNAWSIYFKADDIEKSVQAVADAGGTVIFPPLNVGNMGKMAFVLDGAGAAFGVWEDGKDFQGSAVDQGIGTPTWFESMSKDLDAAIPVYQATFNWEIGWMDTAESPVRYAFNSGDEASATAGLCDASSFLPDDVPSYWRVYFQVENTDMTIEKIQNLGGIILDGPMDSPYGRVATVAGPDGASFQIVDASSNNS